MKKIKNSARYVFAKFGIFLVLVSFFPVFAFAQSQPSLCSSYTSSGGSVNLNGSGTKIGDVLNFLTCLISKSVVPLLFAVAILVFIWGVINFIKEEKAEEREKGKEFMIWGIIAFTVMLGVWGFVAILGSTFGVTNVVPQLPISQ